MKTNLFVFGRKFQPIFKWGILLIPGAQGTFLITFGLSVELVGNQWKTLVGNLTQGWFAIGEALVGVLAYAIRDWRTLQVSTQYSLSQLVNI